MDFVVTQENLTRAIRGAERCVGKNSTLPILSHILLEAFSDGVRVSATNLEIGVVLEIPARVDVAGSAAVPTKVLSSFVSQLPSTNTITCSLEKNTLSLSSGNYTASVQCDTAQDFPIIPRPSSDVLFSVKKDVFSHSFSSVLHCCSHAGIRPELTGVNVVFLEDGVHIAATDSFRLRENIISWDSVVVTGDIFERFPSGSSFVIPAKTVSEVLHSLGDGTEDVSVCVESTQVFFVFGSVRIVSRLIDGKYPDYQQIIPSEFSTTITLSRDEFLRAVRIASIFSGSENEKVRMVVGGENGGKIFVHAESSGQGKNSTELSGEFSGDTQDVVLSPRYLIDALSSFSGESVYVLMNNSSSPVVLRDTLDQKLSTYLIMPIRG